MFSKCVFFVFANKLTSISVCHLIFLIRQLTGKSSNLFLRPNRRAAVHIPLIDFSAEFQPLRTILEPRPKINESECCVNFISLQISLILYSPIIPGKSVWNESRLQRDNRHAPVDNPNIQVFRLIIYTHHDKIKPKAHGYPEKQLQ